MHVSKTVEERNYHRKSFHTAYVIYSETDAALRLGMSRRRCRAQRKLCSYDPPVTSQVLGNRHPTSKLVYVMSATQIYAELLVHIRSVTLHVSLQTEYDHETKVQLSANSEWIELTHEGQSASIRLPTKVGGGGNAILTLPAAPSKDITLRLQVEEKSLGLLEFGGREDGNEEPWTAESLDNRATLYCRHCGQQVFGSGRVHTWKDLPSENWAEMMEFWHCHKPTQETPKENGDAPARKGYAASNKLRASSGTGFVDISHFLLAPSDCGGMETGKVRPSICSAFTATFLSMVVTTTWTEKKESMLDRKIVLALRRSLSDTTRPRLSQALREELPSVDWQGELDGLLCGAATASLCFIASFPRTEQVRFNGDTYLFPSFRLLPSQKWLLLTAHFIVNAAMLRLADAMTTLRAGESTNGRFVLP